MFVLVPPGAVLNSICGWIVPPVDMMKTPSIVTKTYAFVVDVLHSDAVVGVLPWNKYGCKIPLDVEADTERATHSPQENAAELPVPKRNCTSALFVVFLFIRIFALNL